MYWLKLTKLPKALEKHSGDEQTKDVFINSYKFATEVISPGVMTVMNNDDADEDN